MKITWLGQAGLLFETEGKKILVDPYLSDSVAEVEPHNHRRVPVDEKFLQIVPDVILLTHAHLDHTDLETLKYYLGQDTEVCVLASYNAWQKIRKLFGGIRNNYIMMRPGTTWTEQGIVFHAVHAEHPNELTIGILMEAEGKTYYITGDTLYNNRIFEELPEQIDYVFLPVNGRGNNMNMIDAKRFCERIGATAVPLHCGLFDDIDMHMFQYEDKVVPEFFQEIPLETK